MQQERKLVTAEAVESIGIRRSTLYRMVKEGKVPCYKTGVKGRGVRFDVDEVLAALRQPAKQPDGGAE